MLPRLINETAADRRQIKTPQIRSTSQVDEIMNKFNSLHEMAAMHNNTIPDAEET